MEELEYWPNDMFVAEEDEELLKDARKHYGLEVKVEGGYHFFTFVNDLGTWKQQK